MIGSNCVCVFIVGSAWKRMWVCVCERGLAVPAVAAQSGAVGLIPGATLCQTNRRAKSN